MAKDETGDIAAMADLINRYEVEELQRYTRILSPPTKGKKDPLGP